MISGFPLSHFIAARPPESAYSEQIRHAPKPLRIAVSAGNWGRPGGCCAPVAQRVAEVATVLTEVGNHHAETVADDLICEWGPFWASVETNWLATGWFWRSLATQRGWPLSRVRGLLTPQNANLLDAGEHLTIPDLAAALAGNPRLMASLARFFDRYDILLCPVFPDPVPDANGPYSLMAETPFADWFSNLLHGMRYTVLGNESGLPSISVPAGLLDGIPVGALLYGPPQSDGALLQLAAQLEEARPDWFDNAPPLSVTMGAGGPQRPCQGVI